MSVCCLCCEGMGAAGRWSDEAPLGRCRVGAGGFRDTPTILSCDHARDARLTRRYVVRPRQSFAKKHERSTRNLLGTLTEDAASNAENGGLPQADALADEKSGSKDKPGPGDGERRAKWEGAKAGATVIGAAVLGAVLGVET